MTLLYVETDQNGKKDFDIRYGAWPPVLKGRLAAPIWYPEGSQNASLSEPGAPLTVL
jgi:hypothetical protein